MGLLIKEVTLDGIKGCSGTYPITSKNLISGKNGAGKSAIFAAIQLALRGDVDGIGAANSKLGSLASGGAASTTVKVGDDMEAQASITIKKGTSSVSRVFSHGGMPMDTKAIAATLFGKIPQTQSELAALTGEEICEILMPKAGEASIPTQVSYYAGKFPDVSRALANPDLAVAIQGAVDKSKDLISGFKAEIKRLSAIASEETPQYQGMPVHEAKEKLAYYNTLLTNHKVAVTGQAKASEEILRLEQEIDYLQKEMNTRIKNAPTQQEREAYVKQCEQDIRSLEAIAKMPPIEVSPLTIERVAAAETECLAIAEEGFIDATHVVKFFEEARKFAVQGDIETQPRYIAAKPIVNRLGFGSFRAAADDPEAFIERINKNLDVARKDAENFALRNSQSEAKIKQLKDSLSVQAGKKFDIMDLDRLNEVVESQKQAQACIDLASRIESSERTKAETNKKIGEIELNLEEAESMLAEIQAWRRSVIDSTIEAYEREASLFFRTKFEMSTGKRSAVSILIETRDGFKPLATISGAERVLASYQVIRAMQRIKEVKVPVIFIEGGELDPTNLKRLLEKCDDDTTTLVAHYLSADADGINHIFVR